MDVRLTTLGKPTVLLGDQPLPSLPGKPVSFGLLVFLAVEKEATRDRLVSVFWPEKDQEKARHTLSQTLYELRQDLGEEWVRSTGNLVLCTDAVRVDARQFEELAEEGRHREALDLYGGHFLDGVHLAQTHPFEEWVERQRAHLNRKHRGAVDTYINHCRDQGDLDTALKNAWRWVGLDPLDDGGQHLLIEILAQSGNRTEALSQYDRYESLLQAELALDPLDETRELIEAIRGGAFAASLPPSGVRYTVGEGEVPGAGPGASGGKPDAPVGGEASGEEIGAGPGGEETVDETGRAEDGMPTVPEPAPTSTWPTPFNAEGHPESSHSKAKDRKALQKVMDQELSPSLQVLRPIGAGNMAEVYLAREPHLKRLVAVKVLAPHLYSDDRARKRFEREAQSAARINHPHVCTVHRVGSLSDGTPYLVTPFVKGTSLGQRLKAEGRLSPAEVRRVIREVASALAAAHKLGIIHRDVRPDNVLRGDETGRHSLCDFGIAGVLETGAEGTETKITRTGEILGHPAYISPEQMDGEPVTGRADVYSLGVLAHQLLTGHPPPPMEETKKGSSRKGTLPRLEPLEDYLGDTDPDLVELIGKCLAPDPAHRPSAEDVERKLMGDRREQVQNKIDEIVEVNLGNLLFKKRLPQFIGGYLAASWGMIEATDLFTNKGWLPPLASILILVSLPFGFFAVSILGWFHGEKGRQDFPKVERWLLWTLAVGWLAAMIWVVVERPFGP